MTTLLKKANNLDKIIAKSDPQGRGVLPMKFFLGLAKNIGKKMRKVPGLEVLKATWLSAKTNSRCPEGEIEHEVLREWLVGTSSEIVTENDQKWAKFYEQDPQKALESGYTAHHYAMFQAKEQKSASNA